MQAATNWSSHLKKHQTFQFFQTTDFLCNFQKSYFPLCFNIQLQLVVSDSGDPVLSSVPYVVNVEILDVNDHPPLFEKSSYSMTLQENHANVTVGKVTAVDQDRNSVSCYSIGIYLFIYLFGGGNTSTIFSLEK